MSKKLRKKKRAVSQQKEAFWKSPLMKFAVGLMLLTFLVFGNSLQNEYTYDDKPFISKNYIVQKGISGIPTLLTTNFWEGYISSSIANPSYRPLPLVTLAIEYQFFGLNPTVNHFFNVLLYGLTVVLIFFLLNTFLKGKYFWLSLMTAVLFCVHPIHTELVANIKGRDDLLALFNGLMSIYLIFKYQTNKQKRFLVGAVLFFFLALLSKGHMITFVAIIPLCLYIFTTLSLKNIGTQTIPFLTTAIAFIFIQFQITGSAAELKVDNIDNPILLASSASEALATKINVLGLFLQKLTIPHPLNCDYSFAAIRPTTLGNPMIYLWVLIYLSMAFFAIKGFRKKRLWSFAIGFFFITIAPVSNFFIDYVVAFAERSMYTPSLGFILLLSIILYYGMQWVKEKKYFSPGTIKQISWIGISIVVMAFSFKSFTRNPAWKDDLTLFSTDVKTNPESIRLNVLYAQAVINKNTGQKPVPMNSELESAQKSLEKIQELQPNMAKGKLLFGNLYKATGNYPQAENYYMQAKELDSNNPVVYFNLGLMADLKKDLSTAKAMYLKSLDLFPNYSVALANLGIIYGKEKNLEKAIETFEKAILLDPNKAIYYSNLSSAYRLNGNQAKADLYKKKQLEVQQQSN